MQKFKRSWVLFKASIQVIAHNKKLLVFPALSFVLTAVILIFCLTPITLIKTGFRYDQFEHWKAVGQTFFTTKMVAATPESKATEELVVKPIGMVAAAGFYFLSMFLVTFFNVAFFHQILVALKGGAVSLSQGFRFAVSKLPSILLWSLFAGLIGLVIKTLEQRVGWLGQIVLRLVGTAWSVACVFVIPVLIVEPGKSPFAILRQSAGTLRRTWGESLIGYVGIQFGATVVFVLSMFGLVGAGFLAVSLQNIWIFAVAFVGWIAGLIAFGYLSSVASQVYKGALFLYASEGVIPEPFNQELMDTAWNVKGN